VPMPILAVDWLALGHYRKQGDWAYRINVPGTVGPENWTMVAPYSLEEMLELPINQDIRRILWDTGRVVEGQK